MLVCHWWPAAHHTSFARNLSWKYSVCITFSLKENMKTCFDHNSPKSSPIRSSFCTHPRRDTVSLSLLQNYSNPTRNCIFWKSKKNAPRALLTFLYNLYPIHVCRRAEIKSTWKPCLNPESPPIKPKIGTPHLQTLTKKCAKARPDPCRFRKVMIKTSFNGFY